MYIYCCTNKIKFKLETYVFFFNFYIDFATVQFGYLIIPSNGNDQESIQSNPKSRQNGQYRGEYQDTTQAQSQEDTAFPAHGYQAILNK